MSSDRDKAIDVYSYAVSMYEAVFQSEPWSKMSHIAIADSVMGGERPVLHESTVVAYRPFPEIINIIVQAWDQNPNMRPSMESISQRLITSIQNYTF